MAGLVLAILFPFTSPCVRGEVETDAQRRFRV